MNIVTNQLCKSYHNGEKEILAVNHISLTFEAGKFYAIVGRSGCGKSTFLNLLGGLDAPTGGDVFYGEDCLTKMSESKKAKFRASNIGFVFQAFHLEPTYTCLDNVMLPLIAAGYPRKKRTEQACAVLEQVGLSDRIRHKPTEMSGGEKQRAAIARALVNQPSVILADEPTGNLDSENSRRVVELLRKIADSGKLVILVTHNMEDAEYADCVITMKDGSAETEGSRAS